ncbi:MAG: nitrous oxide reductase accessory protein NosL [Acidobacteriia bacterium]|nr:nitrous oxide reductase accessory protein NosL [Terriglobia bacterium]
MKIKNVLIGLILLGVVGGGCYLAYQRLVLPSQQCDICGRPVHAAHDSIVLLKNSSKVHTCCPRCALHYEQNHPGQIAGLLVADRATGVKIDGQKALYVEGSDEQLCGPLTEAPPREPGVEFDRTFDRCLPSLAAFKEEAAARSYQAVHGGRLLTYEQAVESVKKQ